MLCNTAAYRSVLHSSRLVLYHFQQWVTYRHHDITHYLQKVWKSEINTKWLKYVGMWRGMKWRKMEVDVFAFRMKSQVQLNVKEDQTFCFLLYSPLWTSDLRLRFSKFRKILTLKNCKSNSKFFSEFWNYFILSKFLIFFKISKNLVCCNRQFKIRTLCLSCFETIPCFFIFDLYMFANLKQTYGFARLLITF